MSDFANALLFLDLSLMLIGISKAAHDEWMGK